MKRQLLILWLLIPILSQAQWSNIGTIANVDGANGFSVDMSADGAIVAIGANLNDLNGTDAGVVQVYQDNGGSWQQIGIDILGDAPNDQSGQAISLNADGTILAVGSPLSDANGTDSGMVKVYQINSSSITQIGAEIIGEVAGDQFGRNISISDDGNIIAIGGRLNDGNGANSGHVRVFMFNGSSWQQVGNDIDGEAASDQSGIGLSLNSDGTILAIGARFNDGNGFSSGHVRVYQESGGIWSQLGADINGEAAGDEFGVSVDINNDGTIIAVGARGNDGSGGFNSGSARVYQFASGSWSQVGQDIDGLAVSDYFGSAISINDSGDIIAISAPFDDTLAADSGSVRVFENISNIWTQIDNQIFIGGANSQLGTSLSLNSDGSRLVAGAPFAGTTSSGSVRVVENLNVLSVKGAIILNSIELYPNPTTTSFTIDILPTINTITITNINGQQVKVFKENLKSYNVEDLTSGLYFVTIDTAEGLATKKLIKQ